MCAKLRKISHYLLIKCATCDIIFVFMKHKNSISQINPLRDREMLTLYRKALEVVEYPTTIDKICEVVSSLSTSCFYISDTSAFRYVSLRLKGIVPVFDKASYRKQQLYESLYEEFQVIREQYKERSLCIYKLVDLALARPAPCLGLSPRTIRQKLSAHFKQKKKSTLSI